MDRYASWVVGATLEFPDNFPPTLSQRGYDQGRDLAYDIDPVIRPQVSLAVSDLGALVTRTDLDARQVSILFSVYDPIDEAELEDHVSEVLGQALDQNGLEEVTVYLTSRTKQYHGAVPAAEHEDAKVLLSRPRSVTNQPDSV